jgi:hypothetical protein
MTASEFGMWGGDSSAVWVTNPQSNEPFEVKVGELTELPLQIVYVRRARDNGPESVQVKVRAGDCFQSVKPIKVLLTDPELLAQLLPESEHGRPYYIASRSINTATLCVNSDDIIELKDRHIKKGKITVRVREEVFGRLPRQHLGIMPTVEVIGLNIGVSSGGMNLWLSR